MLSDSRYSEEDVLSAIEYLKHTGGKKFSTNNLELSRQFYQSEPVGNWNPKTLFEGKDVLLLGTGPSVAEHKAAIERYIKKYNPVVVALNTQSAVAQDLIDVRIACHPTRLLADCDKHIKLPQPLVVPASMLPQDVRSALSDKQLLDYGLSIVTDTFEFDEYYSILPSSLVVCYALAVITAGQANQIFMAGFDGYTADDPRGKEMRNVLSIYKANQSVLPITAITPTTYDVNRSSIYAL